MQSSQVETVWTNTFQMDLHANSRVHMVSLKVKPALPREESFLLNEMLLTGAKKLETLTGGAVFPTGDVVYCLKPLKTEEEEIATHAKGYSLLAYPTAQNFTLTDETQEANRFLSVVLKTHMEKAGYSENGKRSCYFNESLKPNLIAGRGIAVMPGYKMHIDRYLDGSIRLNVDTVFRISSTYSVYQELKNAQEGARDLDGAKSRYFSENVVGKSFSVQNDMKRMVLIHGVESKLSLSSACVYPGYPTMKAFFEDKYKIKLTKTDQPILFNEKRRRVEGVESKVRTYYPSEILFGLGLKKDQKKDFRLMNEIAAFTKHKPDEKKQLILKFSNSLKMICSEVGLKISDNPNSTIKCKVLKAPTVDSRQTKYECKDGIINFKDEISHKEAKMENLAIIQDCEFEFADNFWSGLSKELKRMGVPCKEPLWLECNTSPTLDNFKNLISEAKKAGCTMVVILLSKKSSEIHYTGIKEYADVKAHVLTQCVRALPATLNKQGFFQKLGYQMCSKLGFPLWVVQKPEGLESKHMTMIVGADVYHQKGKESVAAMVATRNSDYSRFCSVSRVQPAKGQEIMTNMADMLYECIETFKEKAQGRIPKRILLYRDGVGDTMFDLVKTHELGMIKTMLTEKYGADAPKLTMVIVTKRISKKIVKETSHGGVNPMSGTIVNTGIVQNNLEFFMVAQKVTSGTANPTRYQVLVNECGYGPSVLEGMTFFQAFGYYNWTGAVKVPAVCQYAHKLAYHVGENYRQASPFMKLNLYYL